MTNEFIDVSTDNFSITFEDDGDKYQDELKVCMDKLDAVHTEINKLITNLKMNPEKPIIKWPNRIEDIEKFESKINEIIKG